MRLALTVSLLALMGCDMAATTAAPSSGAAARATAAEQFPGVNVDAIAQCVRSNATEDELVLLAEGGAIATQTTQSIMARPATVQCLRDNDVGLEEA